MRRQPLQPLTAALPFELGEFTRSSIEGHAMKCFRSMMVGMLVLSLLILGTSGINAQYGSPHSISLGPSQATAGPGEIVSYTVYVRTSAPSFRGSVLVDIPGGLSVVGQPSCATGCGQPVVSTGGGRPQIETSISIYGEETATFSFQLLVEASARAGTAFNLTAYLLGGVNTAGGSETAFATLVVGSGSESPSESRPASDQPGTDDLEAWLYVSPGLLRVAPGATAVYFVQPVFWGDWSASDATAVQVKVLLPSGVSLNGEPTCDRPVADAPDADCELQIEEKGGSSGVTLRADLSAGYVAGLFLPVAFSPDLEPGSALSIQSFFLVSGGGPIGVSGDGGYESIRALVVDESQLRSSAGG